MTRVQEQIDVNVPVQVAYNQWTQFEEFPRFMDGVKSVKQHDDTRLTWVARIAGKEKTWEAEITQQEPDQRVAWRSLDGAENAGVVDFHRVSDDQTQISLSMDVEPEGPVETAGAKLGVVQGRVKADLERFKKFIESRGQETGAWRGEVEQSNVR